MTSYIESSPLNISYNEVIYGSEEAVELLIERYLKEHNIQLPQLSEDYLNQLADEIDVYRAKNELINDDFIYRCIQCGVHTPKITTLLNWLKYADKF